MTSERHLPGVELRPFIKAFMLVEPGEAIVHHLVPDTSIILAFRYKGTTYTGADGAIPLPACAVAGLSNAVRSVAYANDTATLLVLLAEGSAPAFVHEPLHTLRGVHLSLDHVFQRQHLADVEEQLAAAHQHAQRIAIVERFLRAAVREFRPDRLICHAVHEITTAHGDLRIKDLVARLALSRDAFEKRFRRAVGTSPKQFARIVRLRHLITTVPHAHTLTDVAHQAGYFDQAHFIKDFRAFTGTTPREFFRFPSGR